MMSLVALGASSCTLMRLPSLQAHRTTQAQPTQVAPVNPLLPQRHLRPHLRQEQVHCCSMGTDVTCAGLLLSIILPRLQCRMSELQA